MRTVGAGRRTVVATTPTTDTRASTPDPEVEQLIKDFAITQGVEQREVTDQEVLERCLYPMVNEGAKILEEKIAIRAAISTLFG